MRCSKLGGPTRPPHGMATHTTMTARNRNVPGRTANAEVSRLQIGAVVRRLYSRHRPSHDPSPAARLPKVQATLGHANVSTTGGYLHARPDTSSGLRLDPGVFLQ